MFKKIFYIIIIILISGISGIFADRYAFPRLATTELFSKYAILKDTAKDVTIINKTEQVVVKDDTSVKKVADQVENAMVNVVSYPSANEKSSQASINPISLKHGTGEIVTSDGLIMTSAEAIIPDNANYKVFTSDGNSYDAQLQGVDRWSDLAYLKINASNLPVIAFADSNDYQPGEKLVALGNDEAVFQTSFSQGILNSFDPDFNISGKNLSVSEKMEGVYRIDFNPGSISAGGPVTDLSGQIIGIIGSTVKDAQTVYYAIPSDKVRISLGRAMQDKLDKSPVLGAYYVPITKAFLAAQNLGADHGALIYSPSGQSGLAILAGSPAAKAGLKLNDIITKIGNDDVTEANSLPDLLNKYSKGDKISLEIMRSGKATVLDVEL
jgi:S1-C subfamily serine protease